MHLTPFSRAVLLCLPVLCGRPACYAQALDAAPAGPAVPPGALPTIVAGDLGEVLSGRAVPLSLQLRQLDASWRVFTTGGSLSVTSYPPFSEAVSVAAGTAFYTRGQAVSVGGTTLLIAYRLDLSPAQIQAQQEAEPRRYHTYTEPPAPPRLPAQTPLVLALLNLSQMSGLNNIRPFDPAIIDASATALDIQQDMVSASNLKQVGLALLQYTQDYDEMLPPMRSATSMSQIQTPVQDRPAARPSTAQELLMPYARNAAIFAHPRTHEIYRPNPFLSGKPLGHIAQPSAMAAFYEASPNSDGTRAVLFLDGHVRRVPEDEWPRLKQASHIPGAGKPPARDEAN